MQVKIVWVLVLVLYFFSCVFFDELISFFELSLLFQVIIIKVESGNFRYLQEEVVLIGFDLINKNVWSFIIL